MERQIVDITDAPVSVQPEPWLLWRRLGAAGAAVLGLGSLAACGDETAGSSPQLPHETAPTLVTHTMPDLSTFQGMDLCDTVTAPDVQSVALSITEVPLGPLQCAAEQVPPSSAFTAAQYTPDNADTAGVQSIEISLVPDQLTGSDGSHSSRYNADVASGYTKETLNGKATGYVLDNCVQKVVTNPSGDFASTICVANGAAGDPNAHDIIVTTFGQPDIADADPGLQNDSNDVLTEVVDKLLANPAVPAASTSPTPAGPVQSSPNAPAATATKPGRDICESVPAEQVGVLEGKPDVSDNLCNQGEPAGPHHQPARGDVPEQLDSGQFLIAPHSMTITEYAKSLFDSTKGGTSDVSIGGYDGRAALGVMEFPATVDGRRVYLDFYTAHPLDDALRTFIATAIGEITQTSNQ